MINVFERTYRDVLTPGFFRDIEAANERPFDRKVVLINNVEDKPRVIELAQDLVENGEITTYVVVEDHLAAALHNVGLTRSDLGRIPHYSDCVLVAIHLPGSPWLCYWDAEVRLETPINWIDPAIALMEQDSRVLVANPNWSVQGLEDEADEMTEDVALGYGFSDHVFLCRRADFRFPIYKYRTPSSLRYPLAHINSVFEQRVDAYMRTHRKLRATYRHAFYTHPDTEGHSYPAASIGELLRYATYQAVLAGVRSCSRWFSVQDPRLRTDGLVTRGRTPNNSRP